MRRTLALFKFVVAFSSFIAFSTQAESVPPAETREAQALLRTIQSAAHKLNYSGTFIYQQGSQVRTSRITHLVEGKNEIEKLEVLDGQPREYIRSNDEIICYVPDTKTLLVEKRVTQDVFPAIIAANADALAEHYTIRRGESGRIAGYDCQSVILDPKDDLRYGYRLWADKDTGLLLRAQTLNETGDVVEQISFTQLTIGNVDRNRVKPTFTNTRGWRVENAVMTNADLSNWNVKRLPPGFRRTRELKRMVSDAPVQIGTVAAQREVSQIVFSDGLAAISVFIEPGTQSRTEGSLQQGAMNVVGKRQGEFWLTIVGEVPSTAIRQVANSIEYKPSK
ncbi:MAG: MucB/RseB C-terminal domain-containing protein [Noviherbaspirillum sp.]